MVRPVEEDARGIVAPASGLTKFRLDRHEPSVGIARFVDRYWVVTWDLRGQRPFTQAVLAHPVVNVVVVDGQAVVSGPATRAGSRTLAGDGRALGIMFRPAGFRPLLGRPLTAIRNRMLPLAAVFGEGAHALRAPVEAAADQRAMVAAAEAFLAPRLPAAVQPSEETTAIVEWVARNPAVARVDVLADWAGESIRQLQRRFADHVGLSPKSVIRRYRLYEAAEQARRADDVSWATLAVDLGYSDQAHLTRDFAATFGLPPERYARAAAPRPQRAASIFCCR